MTTTPVRASGVVILLGALLSGCASSPPSRFYTLTPESFGGSGATSGVVFAHSVAVGPVSLPERVDRPQFVVRQGANQIVVLETRRWAEPLNSGIAEAVAGYLSHDLHGARVTPMTQSVAGEAEFDVSLDVQRFEMIVGEAAVVDVIWTIKRRDGAAKPIVGSSRERESAKPVADTADDAYAALVAAQERALASISSAIAAELTRTAGK